MAIHSSTVAWKIPWTEEPRRLQSMGLQRVGHDWATSLSLSKDKKEEEIIRKKKHKRRSNTGEENCNMILIIVSWRCLWDTQETISSTQLDYRNKAPGKGWGWLDRFDDYISWNKNWEPWFAWIFKLLPGKREKILIPKCWQCFKVLSNLFLPYYPQSPPL